MNKDERHNCTVIILGASGDLSKRKLFPALYSLFQRDKIDKMLIVGAALDAIDSTVLVRESRSFVAGEIDEHAWNQLEKSTFYQQLNFTQEADFAHLDSYVAQLEKEHAMSGNRLVYCAAAAHFFCALTKNIAGSGLAKKVSRQEPYWHRIIYEKPFGHNLQSAHEINECIAATFYEHQIYRIDHYLTKELVSNIALIRFTNAVFEPIWDNRYIDNIQIIINEKIGVEGRGAFYDDYGALRDVVQNHMLELLALIGMEAPEKIVGNAIRDQRARMLKKVHFSDGLLGQYRGYHDEGQVAHDSKTETFAALMLRIDNPRWAGVPFYIKTGKMLDDSQTVVYVTFKQTNCQLTQNCSTEPNIVTIQISPQELFTLTLNARKPGTQQELIAMPMEYCHSCRFGAQIPPAYTVLLEEVMRGEQSVSVRFDEIEYAWRLIDTIREKQLPVYEYEQGSDGPKELKQFEQKHGMRWLS